MTTPDRLSSALADRYRIERELGQGGMATVYLAHDLKLDRDVAIKVLRPELGAVLGAERFLAEIKISARLDHPHILTLIDSGASDGLLYYVLPYVRGESLRAKLDREAQLGLDEALQITKHVASALDYAHRQGLVHRDIKPENILLQEGEAMLADFGIALAVSEAGAGRLTETGLSLGTPQYMSPEQATGNRHLDGRSDVYSLGAVLYEMLAGEPPVTGPNAQAMIAKLMTERPTGLRVVRDTVPVGVEVAVAKALAKTPADRFASAGAFVAALDVGTTQAPTPARRAYSPLQLLAGAALVGVVVFAAWRVARPPDTPGLALGRSEALTTDPGLEIDPAISPDGRLVAYSAGNSTRMRLYVRPVGGGRTIPLSDDSSSVETQARWAPDGESLLFLTHGGVSVAPALGGSSRPVVGPSTTHGVAAAAWSPDGQEIVFARGDSLQVIPRSGGTARFLGTGPGLHSCSWAPVGRWIACVSGNRAFITPGPSFGNISPSGIVIIPAEGGEQIQLVEGPAANLSPIWSSDGKWVYFLSTRDGPSDVYGIALTSTGTARGEPVRLTTGLGASAISLAAGGGRLTYSVYTAQANLWSLPIPTGAPTTIDAATQITFGRQVIESMRVSRDGQWLVYDSDLRGNADIYRVPVAGGTPEQLTSEPANEFAPDLSPDGRAVAYHSFRTGTRDIEVKPLDGGPVERVTDTPEQESYPVWSPDGRSLIFLNQARRFAINVVRRGVDGRWSAPTVIAQPASLADLARDGNWVVFIGATTFDAPGPIMVIPDTGGTPRQVFQPGPTAPLAFGPRWSPDGRTIYFKSMGRDGLVSFWSVDVAGGTPRLLVVFADPDRQSSRADFATDGRRFFFAIEDRQSDIFVAEVVRR